MIGFHVLLRLYQSRRGKQVAVQTEALAKS